MNDLAAENDVVTNRRELYRNAKVTVRQTGDGAWLVRIEVPGNAIPIVHCNKEFSRLRTLCLERFGIRI